MPIRDDSAGSYGTWNNDDLSWIDWLGAKASDGGNALSNLGRNLVDGFSPVGTSEQGNMALQVPPVISGIAQSYGRLAGTPSHPGSAYDLTGVPELDAPIQQDMSNVLLSLYGGNAVAGLAKGGATKAVVPPHSAPFDMTFGPDGFAKSEFINGSELRYGPSHDGSGVNIRKLTTPESESGRGQARSLMQAITSRADADGIPLTLDAQAWEPRTDVGRVRDFYGALGFEPVNDAGMMRRDPRALSDTGKPSIFGSALATSSADLSSSPASAVTQPLAMDHASRMARAREMGFDVDRPLYHGTGESFSEFDMAAPKATAGGLNDQGVFLTPDKGVANRYAEEFGGDTPMVYPTYVKGDGLSLSGWEYAAIQDMADAARRGETLDYAHPELQRKLAARGVDWKPGTNPIEAIKANGYGYIENQPSKYGWVEPERLVFDPSNIRSVNAAFDPAQLGENGLLLSDHLPSPLGSALATGGDQDLPPWLRF